MVIGVMLGSTQLVLVSRLNVTLGLSDQLFVLGDTALLTALGQCSFMPLLVLAARICPQGVEATMFATLMSILNGEYTMSCAPRTRSTSCTLPCVFAECISNTTNACASATLLCSAMVSP